MLASILRWIGHAPWPRVGALAVIGLLAAGPSESLSGGIEEAAQELWIPGDHRLPELNERVVVPVPAGAIIRFGFTFDPSNTGIDVQGTDLVLMLESGGELVLSGFFAPVDPPATIMLGDGTLVSAPLLLAGFKASSHGTLESTAAAGAAAGGGELFGLLQVISWFLNRIDLVSESQAAEPQQALLQVETPLLRQLLAQLLIFQEAEIEKLAAEYREATGAIFEAVSARLAGGGGGSRADVDQAKVFHLDAQLEFREATFRRLLAVDAHQDDFGARLETAAAPVWQTAPPDDLSAITTDVSPEKRAMARRYGHQLAFANDTLDLLESLIVVAEKVRDAYRQHFEVAQRTLLDVEYAEKVFIQARVRMVRRQVEKLRAEAWLLAAVDKLSPNYIKQPGWQ